MGLKHLGAAIYRMHFQLLRRLERNGQPTLTDRGVRAILSVYKGVSGWVGEKISPARGSKGGQLSERLGEVIGGGMASSRNFFLKKLLQSTAEDSSAAAGRGSEGRRGIGVMYK